MVPRVVGSNPIFHPDRLSLSGRRQEGLSGRIGGYRALLSASGSLTAQEEKAVADAEAALAGLAPTDPAYANAASNLEAAKTALAEAQNELLDTQTAIVEFDISDEAQAVADAQTALQAAENAATLAGNEAEAALIAAANKTVTPEVRAAVDKLLAGKIVLPEVTVPEPSADTVTLD